jgi:hypothetical protein
LKKYSVILTLSLALSAGFAHSQVLTHTRVDFYGDTIELPFESARFIEFRDSLSQESIQAFYDRISSGHFEPVVQSLLRFRDEHRPDDWLFYQLIRKTAQCISPKSDNYPRYTLYKWFLLASTGYDAFVAISQKKILFYVQSDDAIYNIPYRVKNGKQYVCLNYHDYGSIDFSKESFAEVPVPVPGAKTGFTYKVTRLPNFNNGDYSVKDIRFNYNENEYSFKVKVNPQVKTIFANYPVVDYGTYFNIPLNSVTYGSLIPALKDKLKGMNTKSGVDYLMHFTRYAFLFKPDQEAFGQEKRLTPEQTLLYDNSDCEDRAGLFFYLVKEIYDLPMVVLEYPRHVTIAVKFDKPYGNTVVYNGERYSVCEPSSQRYDLKIGELPSSLRNTAYDIPYVYTPKTK